MKPLFKKTIVIWGESQGDVEGVVREMVGHSRHSMFLNKSYGLPAQRVQKPEDDPNFDPSVEEMLG